MINRWPWRCQQPDVTSSQFIEEEMPHTPIIPQGSAPPLAPYSPGTKAGGVVYVSGMLAMDTNGKTIGVGDVKTQTRAVLNAIKSVVEAAGGAMADITF